MKSYTYYPEFNAEDELLWKVYEKASQQVVAECWFEDDAAETVKFLTNGGGFAGFTPSFMLRRMPVINTNEDFLSIT